MICAFLWMGVMCSGKRVRLRYVGLANRALYHLLSVH